MRILLFTLLTLVVGQVTLMTPIPGTVSRTAETVNRPLLLGESEL